MEKPKIDVNGDGDGDLSKGPVKILLGLVFERERTLLSLESEFDLLMKWIWRGIIAVVAFFVIVALLENRQNNAYNIVRKCKKGTFYLI